MSEPRTAYCAACRKTGPATHIPALPGTNWPRRPHVRHMRPCLANRKDTTMNTQRGRSSNPPYGWLPWNAPAPSGEVEHAKPGRCHECDCTLSKYRSHIRVMKDGKFEPEYCWPCADKIRREDGVDVGPFVAEPEPEPVSSAEAARAAVTAPREPATRRPPPLTLEQKQASRHYQPCTCGRDWHKKGTKHCKHCEADRRRTPGTPGSSFCAKCGERKGHNGGGLCRLCRYPNSEEARLRRLRERAA